MHSQIAEGAIPHLCMNEPKFKVGLALSMVVLAEPIPVGEVAIMDEGAQSESLLRQSALQA